VVLTPYPVAAEPCGSVRTGNFLLPVLADFPFYGGRDDFLDLDIIPFSLVFIEALLDVICPDRDNEFEEHLLGRGNVDDFLRF